MFLCRILAWRGPKKAETCSRTTKCVYHYYIYLWCGRSQCPRSLMRGSAAARLLRLWVRIPPGAWISVSCECCVLSGRGLCDGLICRPEESYQLWCVVVCDLETSSMRRPWPTGGLLDQKINMVSDEEQFAVSECLLSFGAEYFVFQIDIQKFKYQNIENYKFACCFAWVWNLVAHIEGGT